ncbi:MAG: YqeG family HAD IIIA-type phosphatase [candidate division WOR-3 bacterium]
MEQGSKRIRFRRERAPGWLRAFCPSEMIGSVTEITPDSLKEQGLCDLLLDLDNTLAHWRSYQIPEAVQAWVERMKASGIRLCLVSNTRRLKRLRWLSEQLGIPYARGPMKPRRGLLFDALRILGVEPREAAIVGDQVFTDIWGGNRAGLYTIWVRPMHSHEFIGTKISRLIEGWLSKRFQPFSEEVP